MRQRRSGVRSETTAARLTLENLARCPAAIYPVLTTKFRGLPPALPVHFVSRCDLHDRTLDAGARRVPGPARRPWGHPGGGRAPLSGVASASAIRARGACDRAPRDRRRLPSRARARRPPRRAAGFG